MPDRDRGARYCSSRVVIWSCGKWNWKLLTFVNSANRDFHRKHLPVSLCLEGVSLRVPFESRRNKKCELYYVQLSIKSVDEDIWCQPTTNYSPQVMLPGQLLPNRAEPRDLVHQLVLPLRWNSRLSHYRQTWGHTSAEGRSSCCFSVIFSRVMIVARSFYACGVYLCWKSPNGLSGWMICWCWIS